MSKPEGMKTNKQDTNAEEEEATRKRSNNERGGKEGTKTDRKASKEQTRNRSKLQEEVTFIIHSFIHCFHSLLSFIAFIH